MGRWCVVRACCVRVGPLLVRDVALPVTPTDLAKQPWDRQEVHTLFDGLEFRVLRERLFQELTSEEILEEVTFDLTMSRLGEGEVAGWLTEQGLTAASLQGGITQWARHGGRVEQGAL